MMDVNVVRDGEVSYPYVGKYQQMNETTIVIFTSRNEGLCIYSTKEGYTKTDIGEWGEVNFKPCDVELRSL